MALADHGDSRGEEIPELVNIGCAGEAASHTNHRHRMGRVFDVEVRINVVHVIHIVEPMSTINAVHVINIFKFMSSIDAINVVDTVESMGTIKAIDAVSGAILLEETFRYNTLLEGERDDR